MHSLSQPGSLGSLAENEISPDDLHCIGPREESFGPRAKHVAFDLQ